MWHSILFGWLEAFEAAKSCVCTGRSTMSPSRRPSLKPRLSQRRRGGRIETCASNEVESYATVLYAGMCRLEIPTENKKGSKTKRVQSQEAKIAEIPM